MRALDRYARLGMFIAVLWASYDPFSYMPRIVCEIRIPERPVTDDIPARSAPARYLDGAGEAETPRYSFRSRATWG